MVKGIKLTNTLNQSLWCMIFELNRFRYCILSIVSCSQFGSTASDHIKKLAHWLRIHRIGSMKFSLNSWYDWGLWYSISFYDLLHFYKKWFLKMFCGFFTSFQPLSHPLPVHISVSTQLLHLCQFLLRLAQTSFSLVVSKKVVIVNNINVIWKYSVFFKLNSKKILFIF